MAKFSYRIASRELMAKGWSTLTRLMVEATDADGKVHVLPREVSDHGHGAAVLPVDRKRGMVLLVKQWRAGAAFSGFDPWVMEACAGLLDHDDPETCVRREAVEELGVKIHNVQHVVDCFSSPGALSERISLFVAEYGEADRIHGGGGLDHEHEDIEVIEMPLAQALDLMAKGGIGDLKTVTLLQYLQWHDGTAARR
jgi:nudix-type nucleoside diphosphatase (YffH/AdpP family)